jgi:hypothetical protein
MRKTILALATAGALAGTALPALAWDRDDDGYYRHRHYRDYNYNYRPYYRRYDYDDYRPYRHHHWWWRHHHHHDYYDRPYYRRYWY